MENADLESLDDVILFLLPHSPGALFVTNMPQNKLRRWKGRQCLSTGRNIPQREREGTEPPKEYDLLENIDGLVVRFSHGCKTGLGVVGGRADSADLTFQDMDGISRSHLAFTFDDQTNAPVVRDLGSLYGTMVTYDGEQGTRLSNFDWPLIGPSIAKGKHPILNITHHVQFEVFVPERDFTSPDYIEKVRKFRIGTAEPKDLLESLRLQTAQHTRLPSRQRTPSGRHSSRPILYKKTIGKGTFGEVIFVWDLKTREEYVVKRPRKNLVNSGMLEKDRWMKEAKIMEGISHVSTGIPKLSWLAYAN